MAAVAAAAVSAHAHVVWQIGQKDGTGNEFALAPDRYSDFLQHDFGWENNYFLVGRSDAKKSFPYVLPGVNDKWAGSGKYSGRRTQQVNILFDIAKKGAGGAVLNGKPQNSFLVDAREVLKGGTLELWMGPEPNKQWGIVK